MLSYEEVEDVAGLARIHLTKEEIESFQSDLSKVLIFFKELEALPTDTVQGMNHITGRENEARPDVVNEASSDTREEIKKNFPQSEDGYLKVRSVF